MKRTKVITKPDKLLHEKRRDPPNYPYLQFPPPPSRGPPQLGLVVNKADYVLPSRFIEKTKREPPLFPGSPPKLGRGEGNVFLTFAPLEENDRYVYLGDILIAFPSSDDPSDDAA